MRVYKFLSAAYGLDALQNRRLKVARINDLNDPFELLGVTLSDPDLRRAFTATKNALNDIAGLLCFSKRWSNPVLWSHYADSHRGLCLGFDVPDGWLLKVTYTRKRLTAGWAWSDDEHTKQQAMINVLCTKFCHWRYESEVRCFVRLEDNDRDNGHYVHAFSEDLDLKVVLVGAAARVSRAEVAKALGDQYAQVKAYKARPAFTSFNVVRNRDKSLWL